MSGLINSGLMNFCRCVQGHDIGGTTLYGRGTWHMESIPCHLSMSRTAPSLTIRLCRQARQFQAPLKLEPLGSWCPQSPQLVSCLRQNFWCGRTSQILKKDKETSHGRTFDTLALGLPTSGHRSCPKQWAAKTKSPASRPGNRRGSHPKSSSTASSIVAARIQCTPTSLASPFLSWDDPGSNLEEGGA